MNQESPALSGTAGKEEMMVTARTVKSMMITLLLALCCVLASCSGEKADASQTTCPECGMKMAKADGRVVGSQLVCPACAEKLVKEAAENPEEMVVCSACGMKMRRSECVILEGEILCAHCVPSAHGQPGGGAAGDTGQ